jgi:putative ABC transport system permease protein
MAWWSRLMRTVRPDAHTRDIDEELSAHLAEAVARGRDPKEARRALGDPIRQREAVRDVRIAPWLDAVFADTRFGWRQIVKRPAISVAAVLSLGLAMGACLAAFRIIDGLLLRPLPIAHPERLYALARVGADAHGAPSFDDSAEYPLFARLRDAVAGQADLLAISQASPVDLTAGAGPAEPADRQYVSGSLFEVFALRPAVGRLLTRADDTTPGACACVVLGYDYWQRRFGGNPAVVGTTVRLGVDPYAIVGVAPDGFRGTEPGASVDLFVPTMMNPFVGRDDASWFRIFLVLHPGAGLGATLETMQALFETTQAARAKTFVGLPPAYVRAFLGRRLTADPAPTGVSVLQRYYRDALSALGLFVALVLLMACANVASLKMAQASARARELALRVSLGAGAVRLAQVLLLENALLAAGAALVGVGVGAWAAPLVVARINPPARAARLSLSLDWRVVLFGVALTAVVALLPGLLPAVRAASTPPLERLRSAQPGRAWHLPVAAQAAFCALVLFIGGLFVTTFTRLAHQDLGFQADRVITAEVVADPPQSPTRWADALETVRALPDVESAALAGWSLLSGNGSNGFIWRKGQPTTPVLAYFLPVSPGWTATLGIPLIAGRDLRTDDRAPGAALVNGAFAKEFFVGENPVGRWFERELGGPTRPRFQVVGLVGNARYRTLREPITPTVYVPFTAVDSTGSPKPQHTATVLVRTRAADPHQIAPLLRSALQTGPFRITDLPTQQEIDDAQTVRERLLATLASFFASVALLLTAVGIYGVLHYTVQARQREIGIRRAIGAPAGRIARAVTARIALILATGTFAGLGLGLLVARRLGALFYGLAPTDLGQLTLPCVAILAVGLLAGATPIVRALRVSPTVVLRAD